MNIEALIDIVGADGLKTDDEARRQASGSWSPEESKRRMRGLLHPAAVVLPSDADSVAAVVRWANEHAVRLVPVGGGSNTVGSAQPSGGDYLAVDLSRLQALDWDEESLLVHVGAGWNLGELESTLNAHDYTLGQFPQSLKLLTVGGAISSNVVGLLSGKYGRQSDITRALTVVLGQSEILRTRASPLGSPYFDLHNLIIGAEGAFGIVTDATLRMRPAPEARAWAAFTFPSLNDGIDALRLIHRSDAQPTTARLLDHAAAGDLAPLAGMDVRSALLLLCFEGDELVQTGHFQLAYAVCVQVGGRAQEATLGDRWFEERRTETGGRAANGRPGGLSDVFAVSASYSSLKRVHADMRRALAPLVTAQAAEFSAASSEGAALEISFQAQTDSPDAGAALDLYDRIRDRGLDACLSAGGAVAHHYGVGQTRRRHFAYERGEVAMGALRALQRALDPNGILNRGAWAE